LAKEAWIGWNQAGILTGVGKSIVGLFKALSTGLEDDPGEGGSKVPQKFGLRDGAFACKFYFKTDAAKIIKDMQHSSSAQFAFHFF
jgi:hypothetical protein